MDKEKILLFDLIQLAASNQPFFRVQEELALKPLDLVGADKCSLYLLNGSMISFDVALARGFLSEKGIREGERYEFSDVPRYVRDTVTTRSIIHVNDIEEDPRIDRDIARAEGYVSLTSIPVIAYGSTIGVLTYYYSKPKVLPPSQERLLRAVSELLALRVQKLRSDEEYEVLSEELEANTITCPLTKLYNKRFLIKRLQEEVSRSQRYNRPLSLLIFDIDNLLGVNETYGSPIGDAVLIEFARLLSHAVRVSDVAARYGGDEFALLAVETDQRGATVLAERLVSIMAERKIREFDVEISVTCCAGVASIPSPGIFSGDQFIEAAQEALSIAKDIGPGQVAAARERK